MKNKIIQQLKSGVCEVVFRKKDDTLRKMKCSLHSSFFKDLEQPLNEDPDRIFVYDLEKKWIRSFYLKSVVSYRTIGRIKEDERIYSQQY